MKLVTIIFSLFQLTLSAQEYHTLLEENKHWRVNVLASKSQLGGSESVLYSVGTDTILDNIEYKIINKQRFGQTNFPNAQPIFNDTLYGPLETYAAMREDTFNRKVYSRYFDNGFTEEFLSYDFNLTLGDTLCVNNSSECLFVSSIVPYVLENGEITRKISFDFINGYESYHFIIEGVGGESGLIEPIRTLTDYYYYLSCVSYFDDSKPKTSDNPEESIYGNCSNFTSNVNENNQHFYFSIYPNPTQDIININAEVEIDHISLYDTNMNLLKTIDGNQKKIDISQFSSGIYLAKVVSINNTSGILKIVKHL